MSEFTNVTDEELDLQVDGRRHTAAPGESVSIPDEFDYQLASQPYWEIVAPATSTTPDTAPVTPDTNTDDEGAN